MHNFCIDTIVWICDAVATNYHINCVTVKFRTCEWVHFRKASSPLKIKAKTPVFSKRKMYINKWLLNLKMKKISLVTPSLPSVQIDPAWPWVRYVNKIPQISQTDSYQKPGLTPGNISCIIVYLYMVLFQYAILACLGLFVLLHRE